MSRFQSALLALVSGVISWAAYYWAAGHMFHQTDPLFVSLALILSVFLHEVGHWVMLERNGIKSYMVFLVLLGGVLPNAAGRVKMKNLAWSKTAAVALAGVVVNYALAIGGVAMAKLGILSESQGLRFANLNAVLVIWNLIPVLGMDGQRFAKALFDSSPEEEDGAYARWIIGVVGISIVIAAFLFHQDFLIIYALFFFGAQHASTHDDPNGSTSRSAMNRATRNRACLVYLFLFAVSVIIVAATPRLM